MAWAIWVVLGSISGACAVGTGAFAAHGLKARLDPDLLQAFQTGATYQMYHAFALIAVGLVATRVDSLSMHVAGWGFILGTMIFSGSLYALAMTQERWWGMCTPIGGAAFIVGWLALGWGVFRAAV